VLGAEDNIIRKEDRNRLAIPAAEDGIPDTQRPWLHHDLDREWKLIVSKVPPEQILGRGQNDDRGLEAGARRLSQCMRDQGPAAQRQKLLRDPKLEVNESAP